MELAKLILTAMFVLHLFSCLWFWVWKWFWESGSRGEGKIRM